MARSHKYDDHELAQLKQNVSVMHVCATHGIALKKHGSADYVGRCPFHEEDKASFIVTPSKNLWHCMGCDKGGSVIDLIMELDGLTFREAADQLMALMTSTGLISRGSAATKQKEPKNDRPEIPAERAVALLERAVTIYEKNLTEAEEGTSYLDHRGITDMGLLTRHRAGYCKGDLSEILPGNGNVRDELAAVGILLDPTDTATPKRERFAGCVVFPVLDVDGNLVTLYGRYTNDGMKRHVFLPGRSTGLWNAPAMKTYSELILVESVLDALSVEIAGFPNVVAAQGTNGLSDSDIADMKLHGVSAVTLLLDGDDAGAKACGKLRPKLEAQGLAVTVKALPADEDPNGYLTGQGAEALPRFLASDAWTPSELNLTPGPAPEPSVKRADGAPDQAPGISSPASPEPGRGELAQQVDHDGSFTVTCGPRAYRLMGLEKSSRKLKITVRVEHAGRLHVDTLDFYSSRSRKILAGDLCRLYEETAETIEADIGKLIKRCETVQLKAEDSQVNAPAVMTPRDKAAAEAFGRRPDLIDAIQADFEKCGLVGEEPNKLLAYLAAVSRKMDAPLSLLVLSSSGAGKTALQDCALAFVPPEDLVKLTSLSGKALFYKERLALKHKVLALEEGDGAEEATYAIRNLISAGELVIESTIKDLGTGRLTTMENRVEGPTSVFITTTNPETDPETKSRFFVTSIDEGREQTRRILIFQRQRQTLDGLVGNMAADAILKRHHNFQRLLNPVAVVNPFADRLAYGDDRLQGRRDQPKYLNLIRAVTFLRQMQKDISHTKRNGETVPYVLVDVEDMRVANRLAHEILGRSLDELSRPGRSLLLLLDEMVEQIVKRLKKGDEEHRPSRTAVTFTRREIREATGWAHTRVHRYLKELVDLEYVLIDTGRNGTLCRYRLAYEGQGKNGERFMLGLTDPEELA